MLLSVDLRFGFWLCLTVPSHGSPSLLYSGVPKDRNQGLLCFFPTGLYITHIVSSSPSGSPFSDILTHSLSLAHIYARFPLYLKKNTLNSVFFLRYRSPLFYQQPLMPSVSIVSTLSLNLLMKRVGWFAFGVPPPKNG